MSLYLYSIKCFSPLRNDLKEVKFKDDSRYWQMALRLCEVILPVLIHALASQVKDWDLQWRVQTVHSCRICVCIFKRGLLHNHRYRKHLFGSHIWSEGSIRILSGVIGAWRHCQNGGHSIAAFFFFSTVTQDDDFNFLVSGSGLKARLALRVQTD